jgi:hypothetical protein
LLKWRKRQFAEVVQGLQKGTGPQVELMRQPVDARFDGLAAHVIHLHVAPTLPGEVVADKDIF